MRKRSFMPIRLLAALLALLLMVLSLPVVPAQAAPASSNEDHDDIAVLSVIVNTNTETNEVFTELVLQNKGSEDKQITFSLPEVYAGIDTKTLTVKTANGEELVHDSGTVTLDIQAGGFAGVSYTYKTKKNLVYEHVIGIDLKQLSALFNDRIGHLEWTVDMPLYELILVNDIQPVNYTVDPISTPELEELVGRFANNRELTPKADNYRICVELDDFPVSRWLKNVCISRTTQMDLMEMTEDYSRDNIYRLIIEHYRDLYRVDYYDRKTPELTTTPSEILYQLYLKEYAEESESEWDKSSWDSFYGFELGSYEYYSEFGTDELQAYALLLIKALWYKIGSDRPYLRFVLMPDILDTPAYNAIGVEQPTVYAVIPTPQPDLAGMPLVRSEESTDWKYVMWNEAKQKYIYIDDEEAWEREDVINILEESVLLYPTDEMLFLSLMGYNNDSGGPVRYAYISITDSDDLMLLRDYLNAIHADAVVRVQIARKDGESGRGLLLQGEEKDKYAEYYKSIYGYGTIFSEYVFRPGNLAYSGTQDYPFESFEADLQKIIERKDADAASDMFFYQGDNDISLIRCEEPLKSLLPIPIFTQYVAYAVPVEEMRECKERLITYNTENELWSVEAFGGFYGGPKENALHVDWFRNRTAGTSLLEDLRESPSYAQILERRNAEIKEVADANAQLLSKAREELNLLEVPEAPTEAPTEVTTEDATEVATEAPTEYPTEAPTEGTTVPSTEAVTEATEESTEESITEASTAAVADETETFASKDTRDPSDKGILILLIAIGAGIVVAGAATTAVLVKKKSNKRG